LINVSFDKKVTLSRSDEPYSLDIASGFLKEMLSLTILLLILVQFQVNCSLFLEPVEVNISS